VQRSARFGSGMVPFARGTYPNGTKSDCPPGVTSGCTPIQWPGERTTARHELEPGGEIRNWFGGLADGMRDASGQMYMRNRYYDPKTGQFTQTDPIGLAGGLNAYGFAAGDPVSYSDPYGLRACGLWEIMDCVAGQVKAAMKKAGHEITDLEAAYYVRHPGVMFAAAQAVAGGSIFADRMARKYPQLPGVLNAARHQFGQCIMTQRTDERTAAVVADLHEAGRPPSEEDSRLDQANNRIGRALGRNASTNCQAAVEGNIQSGNYNWEAGAAGQFVNPLQ
jgi:RHS repeat-associated protein